MNPVVGMGQPHHYFGEEYLPLHHYSVKEKGNPIYEVEPENKNSKNHTRTSIVEPTSVMMDIPSRKKKDGGRMSRSPTLPPSKSPHLFTKMPSLASNAPTVYSSKFPSLSPRSGEDTISLTPTKIAGNSLVPMSGDERSTKYISVAFAFAFILLIICAVVHLSKKRQKSINSTMKEDPALCGDASIASEHSSTFQYNEDGTSVVHYSASKKFQKDFVGLSPRCPRRNKNVLGETKNSIYRFLRLNATAKTKEKENDATVYFSPSSPYLVENFSTTIQQNSTDKTTINDIYPSFSRTDEPRPIELSDFHSISSKTYQEKRNMNTSDVTDPITIVVECEKVAWRDALVNFDEETQEIMPKQQRNDGLRQPNFYFGVESDHIFTQSSMDEESTRAIYDTYPEVVRQVKSVEKTLSEGLYQYQNVDRQFSFEIEKLEASLLRAQSESSASYCDDPKNNISQKLACLSTDVDKHLLHYDSTIMQE